MLFRAAPATFTFLNRLTFGAPQTTPREPGIKLNQGKSRYHPAPTLPAAACSPDIVITGKVVGIYRSARQMSVDPADGGMVKLFYVRELPLSLPTSERLQLVPLCP